MYLFPCEVIKRISKDGKKHNSINNQVSHMQQNAAVATDLVPHKMMRHKTIKRR